MRKIIILIFCLLPMYSSTYPREEKIVEQPEIRLVKKLETFNKELQQLQELILKDEEL